ncbi:CLUMA_CG013453, isoform A [Clunio marinus]|uniref:CLUMA_CG013453, isoform A n=1 Tax=Clunio marinus TaxID=568069 RepID=A0A1J1IIY1_9DIPT|nr:CLUMA_CG013453, isoform A [Clunio marinus]
MKPHPLLTIESTIIKKGDNKILMFVCYNDAITKSLDDPTLMTRIINFISPLMCPIKFLKLLLMGGLRSSTVE